MMRPLLYVLLSTTLLVAEATAEVVVEVLDATREVYSYEPVYVLFEARNEGPEPVVIPAGDCLGEGGYLEIAPVGEALKHRQIANHCSPKHLVSIPPAARWLFLRDLAPGPEDEYELQAVLRSPGQCGGVPIGPRKGHVKPVRPLEPHSSFDCWSGEERSEMISITVRAPDDSIDLAAALFLELDHVRWRNNWKASFMYTLKELSRSFPTSHYTYAALYATAGSVSMLNGVIMQPDNPLNPWVAGAMAAGLAHRHRPCAPPYKPGPGAAPLDLAERYQRVIAAYPPPEPLEDYLRQQALEHENEDCDPARGKAIPRPPVSKALRRAGHPRDSPSPLQVFEQPVSLIRRDSAQLGHRASAGQAVLPGALEGDLLLLERLEAACGVGRWVGSANTGAVRRRQPSICTRFGVPRGRIVQ